MNRQSLDGKWHLSFTLPDSDKRIETDVRVPCNVEPYLVELGLVDDYFPADDPFAMQLFEAVDDWTYTTEFDAPPIEDGARRELVFEGIDTIAEVYLNGEKILDCENMHMTYRVDVTDRLKERGNELRVVVRSSELWAREHPHDMSAVSRDAATTYDSQSHLRKARHQWGWDNAPRLLTSGIVRSVYIETLPQKRFEDVYFYTEFVDENYAQVGVNWLYRTDRRSLADHFFRFSLIDGDKAVFSHTGKMMFVQGSCRYKVDRSKVSLWWSSGFGEPKLYTARLEILEGDLAVAVHEESFGIRTLELEWTEEVSDEGGEFVFRLNGERVYIRGTNWKPLDPLVSLADRKLKTGKALEEIKALNCNMVRIWGGGIYEDPFFFDYCDRNGIMIWQDFMLACETSASDDFYCSLVDAEARQVIRKYRNHPSLAVWCGDNENDQCMSWVNRYTHVLPSDNRISREILRRAVLACDPYRTYVPSSPFVSDRIHRQSGEKRHFQTEEHLYQPMHKQAAALRACRSLFLGETGPVEANAISPDGQMLLREAHRAKRLWDEEIPAVRRVKDLNMHQSEYYFKKWRQSGRLACEAFFGHDFSFAAFDEYRLALNFLCAELFKDIIEYCRVTRWEKTGVIWWSLMDMFPMLFNYSVIDCNHNRKLPYYWIQKSQQEVALMCVRRELDGEMTLYAANDTLSAHTVRYKVTAYGETGEETVVTEGEWTQAQNSASPICSIDVDGSALLIVEWDENGRTFYNHALTGKTSYETVKRWIFLIGDRFGIKEEMLELKQSADKK